MSVVYLHFILKVKIVLYLGVVTILCEYEGQYSFYGQNINFLLSFIKPCVTKHQAVSIGQKKFGKNSGNWDERGWRNCQVAEFKFNLRVKVKKHKS